MQKKWYLITYDVRDPKRLRQTAKKLLGFGTRIQMSVFRCRLSLTDYERLNWELSKILAEEDDLLLIEICEKCAKRIRDNSGKTDWSVEKKRFEIM
ncbi:MAG: CRISPR-associated endonuclease Cas2 [Planctomycetia bacterium]|nr:CRISPR-associated endonuclease Cas2 [Planctomycetia bacterium]